MFNYKTKFCHPDPDLSGEGSPALDLAELFFGDLSVAMLLQDDAYLKSGYIMSKSKIFKED